MRPYFILAAAVLAFVGQHSSASCAKAERPQQTIVVVTANYPGANAKVVADTIAAPLEQQINGVEGLARIESISGNDGAYMARLYCTAKTDATLLANRVQKRVALAEPTLPDIVRRKGVPVKVERDSIERGPVAIAVTDRQDLGWNALEETAAAVLKRLASADAIAKPAVFPVSGTQVVIAIDRAKCAKLGVSFSDVQAAVAVKRPEQSLDKFKSLEVGKKVTLAQVADLTEVNAPSVIYRLNMYPAILISGAPPADKSAAEAAAQCLALAGGELKRRAGEGFAVEGLEISSNSR